MIMDQVAYYTITVFINQLIFISARTWNVKSISKNNLAMALLSGVVVNLSWLVTIAIGSVSMIEIINNFEWRYLPVIVASVAGGTLGTWIGMQEKKISRKGAEAQRL